MVDLKLIEVNGRQYKYITDFTCHSGKYTKAIEVRNAYGQVITKSSLNCSSTDKFTTKDVREFILETWSLAHLNPNTRRKQNGNG